MIDPNRRYVAVRTVGKVPAILHHVHQAVRSHRLAGVIPAVNFEKRARRGEFYVFLAVEGVEGNLPQEVQQVLRLAHLHPPYHWPLLRNEIQAMVMGSEIETHGLNSLTYRPFVPADVGDPFDSSSSTAHPRVDPETSEGFARLLGWLSFSGSGSWDLFVKACRTLELDQIVAPNAALRHLQLLGHLEVARDGRRWSVAPPSIVQSSNNASLFFLAGQRTPKMVASMRATGAISEVAQPDFVAPPRIELAVEVSDRTGFTPAGDVASRMADLLPSLDNWKKSLPVMDRLNASNYNVEYWAGDRFQLCTFVEGQHSRNASGTYRLTRRSGCEQQLVAFYDRTSQRWLQADWHALRFLALSAEYQIEPVIYNRTTASLLIPAQQRWPVLYEKALVLASGLLPAYGANPHWLDYRSIPLSLCQALAAKLNIRLEEAACTT